MRRVILESPYAGDRERNIEYARECLIDSLNRGEAPLVSHLLYTRVLDDDDSQRAMGIAAGQSWIPQADAVVVYGDHGISNGMEAGIAEAESHGITIEYRKIEDGNFASEHKEEMT